MELDELMMNDVVGWSTKVIMTIDMAVLIQVSILTMEFRSDEDVWDERIPMILYVMFYCYDLHDTNLHDNATLRHFIHKLFIIT